MVDGSWANMNMAPIVTMARREQPGVIVVDRHGEPQYVNYLTPEQKIPDHYIASPWETCLTMGKSWSYIPDEVYKPSRQLVQMLVDIVAKNGNLLLDIGPGPDGEWHQEAYDRLAEIGKWIAVNGESIYNTKPLAPYRQGKWSFTVKGKCRYISYFAAENEQLLPDKLQLPEGTQPGTIKLLGYKPRLSYLCNNHGIEVSIPAAAIKQAAGQPVWVFCITGKR